MMRRLAAALVFWAGVAPLDARAQAPDRYEGPRGPKIALVLSGGGARGLAHIGVLKVLRDARVPVDLIVATSMGSIVGGAYAAGITPEEMEAQVRDADWNQIFSDRAPREYLSFRRKEDDLRLIGRSELGIKNGGLVLPRGAIGSQNLEEFLRALTRPASDLRTLNDLPILFRAVATDLVTGEQVVLADVPLAVAMRASMSVPGAFAPTQVEGRLLGDGGLVRNLPIEVARQMGADVIIAVNVGTPLLPKEALASAFGVAQQMINILTEQNVGISLGMLLPEDILISPELGGVSFVDFEHGPELVVKGEAAGRAAQDRLKGLALSPERYAAWEAKRTRPPEAFERPVTTTIVSGTERTNAIAILREVERRAGVVVGETASDEQLVAAARVVHGTGDYERVDVRTHLDEGRRIVTIDVDEKPWGPDYLRFGGRALSDFQTDARFTLTVQHTRTWMNSWGAEWRNELNLGDMRGLATSWYQPLGPGSPWFVEGLADTRKFNVDVFDSNFRRTDRLTNTVNGVIGAFGLRLGNSGVARLGGGYERYTVAPLIGTSENGTTKDRAKFWLGDVRFDTIDDPNFPRRGYVAELQTTRYYYDSLPGEPVQGYAFAYLQPITFDRLTLMGTVNAARSTSDRGGFSIGGFLQLSGTPANSLTGSEAYLLSALTYYRLPTLVPKAIGRNLYAGFSLEAGNSWRRRSDVDFSEWRKAGSVFLGLDSIIGPLYLGWGKTAGGDSSFYLFLGRPTDQVRMR